MKEHNRAEELLLLGNDVVLVLCLAHVCFELLLQSWVKGLNSENGKTQVFRSPEKELVWETLN